jgi:hypothetical protein
MKLRIQGNSIRLRLSRSEVEHFGATGHISETVEFGSGSHFTYSFRTGESLAAVHNADGIQIVVPHHEAQDWAHTDRVSIEGEQPLARGRTLEILIEKDFKCIHKSADANEDAYPNPLAGTAPA